MRIKTTILFFLIIAAAIITDSGMLLSDYAIDLPSFYYSAQAVSEKISPYDIDMINIINNSSDHIYPYVYSPILAQLISPISKIQIDDLLLFWRLGGILILAFSLSRLNRHFRFFHGENSKIFWFDVFAVIFSFLISAQRYIVYAGQIDLYILAFIILSFTYYRTNDDNLSGFFLALAIMIKTFPIFLLVYYVFKDRRILYSSIGWSLTFIAISLLIFGKAPWYEFIEIIKLSSSNPDLLGIAPITDPNNSSIIKLLFQLSSNMLIAKISSIALFTILFIFGIFRIQSNSSIYKDLFDLNLVLVVMLFWTPYLWRQHFIYLLPGTFLMIYTLRNSISTFKIILIYLAMIITPLLSYDYIKLASILNINIPNYLYSPLNALLLIIFWIISFLMANTDVKIYEDETLMENDSREVDLPH